MCQSNSFITVLFWIYILIPWPKTIWTSTLGSKFSKKKKKKYLGFETVQPWSPWLTCKDHLVISLNHSLQPSAITLTQLPKSVQPNNTMGGYRMKAIYFWLVNLFCSSCHLLRRFGRDESGRVMSFVGGIRLSGGGWRWL